MKKTKGKKAHEDMKPETRAEMEETLRKAAYYRWLERGAPLGDDLNDWYEVENRWRDNIVPANNN
ncbi:MAG TPA: DUF2934 domain-containing protein [bacterium]|nr:DUF2934 domain-containing protein [bacterium]